MARKLFCDRCHQEVDETDEAKREWTALALSKELSTSPPFQKEDLCPRCTAALRLWLQGATLKGAPQNMKDCL